MSYFLQARVKQKLYKDVKNCIFIQLQCFRWTGHLRQLNGARKPKKIYQPNLNQQRHTGTPEAKWNVM
jgi:hypothetical protein